MMSCKTTCAPFTSIKPVLGRPCVVRTVRCSAAAPAESQQNMTRRSVGALLAGIPLLAISAGAACAEEGLSKPGQGFGGGPKVPTFGSGPAADTDKGGPKIPNYGPGNNLGKNSIIEKALTDNSPTKQYNRK